MLPPQPKLPRLDSQRPIATPPPMSTYMLSDIVENLLSILVVMEIRRESPVTSPFCCALKIHTTIRILCPLCIFQCDLPVRTVQRGCAAITYYCTVREFSRCPLCFFFRMMTSNSWYPRAGLTVDATWSNVLLWFWFFLVFSTKRVSKSKILLVQYIQKRYYRALPYYPRIISYGAGSSETSKHKCTQTSSGCTHFKAYSIY